MPSHTKNIFEFLPSGELTLHLYLNLEEAFITASQSGTLSEKLEEAYLERLDTRISLLLDFITEKALPIHLPYITYAIQGPPEEAKAASIMRVMKAKGLTPTENMTLEHPYTPTLTIICGGPGVGKSAMAKEANFPEGGVLINRESLFRKLSPFDQVAGEDALKALRIVAAEADFYNYYDHFRYSICCRRAIAVESPLQYEDLGKSLIQTAREFGYFVHMLHMDCTLETAKERIKHTSESSHIPPDEEWTQIAHIRANQHFFKYLPLVDLVECYNTDEGVENMVRYAGGIKNPIENVKESTFIVSKKIHKYDHLVRAGGNIEIGSQRIELIHSEGTSVLVFIVSMLHLFQQMEKKSLLSTKDSPWPANFKVLKDLRSLHKNILDSLVA
jgi:predicted ABC-type ATPase